MTNQQLEKLDQATRLLAEAKTVQEVKQVIDLAEMAKLYAKKMNLGKEAEQYAFEIKLEAERKMGQTLMKMEKNKGAATQRGTSVEPRLEELGVTKKQSFNTQNLAKLPDEKFEKIKAGELSIEKAKKEIRNEESNKKAEDLKVNPPKMPEGEFDLIYADPPWSYEFAETDSRAIENKYPTMDLEEIKKMKIPAADNSVLYMWATAPKLQQAFEVLEAWGFEYKTCAVWDKEIIGSGYWFRGQHEILMVATRGKFSPPLPADRTSSVYREQRTKHSKKPEYYYELLEKCFPNRSKLELFSRKQRAGWSVFGNEI